MFRCGIFPVSEHAWGFQTRNVYPLVKASCHYTVVDVNVHARLTQTYVSSAQLAQDVKYVFPLSSDAAVCAFTAVIDDKRTIHGVVKQKQQAKLEYDQAVAQGKTAGLLDQHTADVFQVSLGNLNPGQKIAVNISFVSVVAHDGKLDNLRITLPLSIAPNYGDPPASLINSFNHIRGTASPFELTMSFSMAANIMSITSRTHPIALSLGTPVPDWSGAFDTTQAHVSLTTTAMLDKDVVVVLKAAALDHPRCIVERSARQTDVSDAIALTLVPRFNVPPLPAQEYIFLIDRSGSMRGGRMAAVRTALQIMLRSLPARGTTFNLFSFGSRCDSLWPASVEYSAESVEQAAAHVDSMEANYGGTEIRSALQRAFESRPVEKRTSPTMVLLLTDGEAWDIDGVLKETQGAVAEAKGALRVFVLGVGDQVSTNMCDSIARAGHGVAAYVGEQEKPDAKLMNMLKAARGAAVENITVDWGVPLESNDEVDDFEIVESVAPAAVNPPPSVAAAPISLFDPAPSAEPDVVLGPDAIAVDLGPVPRIQQTNTAKLGILYPGFRTSLFAIIQQPRPSSAQPTNVTVRGTVLGAPVELQVPVTPAAPVRAGEGEPISDFVHVLAARAFVQTLEDELNKTAHVKAQIVRLATTYGIASSQTSFVAIDEDSASTPISVSEVSAPSPVEANRGPGRGRGGGGLFSMMRATRPMALISPGAAPAPQALQVLSTPAPASSQSTSSQRFMRASPKSNRHTVQVEFDDRDRDRDSMPRAMSVPQPSLSTQDHQQQTQVDSAAQSYELLPDDQPMARGGSSFNFANLKAKEVQRQKKKRSASSFVAEDATSPRLPPQPGIPTVESVARSQQFDGSFAPGGLAFLPTAAVAGVPSTLSALALGTDVERVWSTLLAVAFLQKHFADDEESWTLLADKAKDFVVQILTTRLGVNDASADAQMDEWILAAKQAL